MLRITLDKKFKSLLNNIDIILPDFTIISGINGSGKSHLLLAISNGSATVYNDKNEEIKSNRYVTSANLTPNDSYQVSRESLLNDVNTLYNSIQSNKEQFKNDPNAFYSNNHYQNFNFRLVLKKIVDDTGKLAEDLTVEDIVENFPLTQGIGNEIFSQSFSAIFKRYMDRYEDNFYYEYLKEKKGINKRYLTEEQFFKKHGIPPWNFVNRIFEESQLDYRINHPIENNRDAPYLLKLINKTNGAEINFTDLSSGEKVLMSLTLALYNTKQKLQFPKLLLLDEPDAPLHPSMAKQLIRVIEEIFVKENRVKVIMTTHSPSTIAMAPDDSLYVMQREEPRLIPKSKEQIMKLLTDGIPSFSIYADNRRQVFTESQVDADFYNKVYGKLKSVIPSDKSLYFLSSGTVKSNSGNCEQVKDIVKLLTDAGNKTIYGIIDWDKANTSNGNVLVLGDSKRYSIENYIFDPIIIAIFLLREKIKTRSYFSMNDDENFFDIPKFDRNKMQYIADVVIGDIAKSVLPTDNTRNLVFYYTGITIEIPIWYLHHQGHGLESIIRNTYPELNRFQKKLNAEIVDRIIDDLPEFISLDILDTFQKLHL